MASNQRMMSFSIHIDGADGKEKIVEVKRAVTDYKGALEQLNSVTADNVKVTGQQVSSEQEAARTVRQTITLRERELSQANKIQANLEKQISLFGKTEEEQLALMTAAKLGTTVTDEQREAIERLTTELNELNQAQAAQTASDTQAAKLEKISQQYSNMNTAARLSAKGQAIFNAQVQAGVAPLSAEGKALANTVSKHYDYINSGSGVIKSMRNMRGVAQNLGWQMQDTVVQLQMGTDAFIVMSQQGSQMLSAFGAWGALAGAGVALVGAAMPALIDYFNEAEVSTEELKESQELLNEVFKDGETSVSGFTDEMKELILVDKQAAEVKIGAAIAAANVKIQGARKDIKETGEEFIGLSEKANAAFTGLGTNMTYQYAQMEAANSEMAQLAETYGISQDAVNQLSSAYQDLSSGGSINDFIEQLRQIQSESDGATEEFSILANQLYTLAQEAGASEAQLRSLKESLNFDGVSTGLDPVIAKYEKLTRQIGLTSAQKEAENIIDESNIRISKLVSEGKLEEADAERELLDKRLESQEVYEATKAEYEREISRRAENIKQIEEEEKAREKANAAAIKAAEDKAKAEQKAFEKQKAIVDKLIAYQGAQTRTIDEEYEHRMNIIQTESVSADQAYRARIATEEWYTDSLSIQYDRRDREIERIEKQIEKQTGLSDPFKYENQTYQDNVSTIQEQIMVAEKLERYEEISELNQLLEDEERRHNAAIYDTQLEMYGNSLDLLSATTDTMTGIVDMFATSGEDIRESMEDMTEAQQVMFVAQQAFVAMNAVLAGYQSANAIMSAPEAYAGLPAWLSLEALAQTQIALGYAQAGTIAGFTLGGFFDKGGQIQPNEIGVVSEYADELVNGVMVKGPATVTGSQDTARIMNSDNSSTNSTTSTGVTVNVYQNNTSMGDKQIAEIQREAAQQGAEAGAAKAVNEINRSIMTNGTTRQAIKKMTGV